MGMDLLQNHGANVDARTMHITWAPAGADAPNTAPFLLHSGVNDSTTLAQFWSRKK